MKVKMKRSGFSLIEFLVYLTVSSTICLLLCNWVVGALHTNALISQKNSVQLSILAAFDCYARDSMCAPSIDSAWLKTEPHYILWRQSDRVIGYQFDKQQIMRVAGRYNVVTHSVYKKTRSRIAAQVTDCQFNLKKEGNVIAGIEVNFSLQKGSVSNACKQYIALRNH